MDVPAAFSRLLASAAVMVTLATPARSDVGSGFGVAAGGGIAARRESYKTDLFTGSGALSIPLVIPPGTNGHQPTLAISYSSGAGMTWLGQGWDLSVPSIRRVGKRGVPGGVPEYDDDELTGDRFEIEDDRLVRDGSGVYRRSRDNFDRIERIESEGVVDSWVLLRSDGTRLEFGSDDARRVKNGSDQTFEWLLAREVDSNGNLIEYAYYNGSSDGLAAQSARYLKRISYGFRGESLASPTLKTVDFLLQDRPDHSVSYRGAVRQRMFDRLDRIEVAIGGQRVTAYDVRYYGESELEGSLPANRRSLVRRVVRIGAVGSSELPADVYAYSGAAAGTWTLDPTSSSRLAQLRLPAYANGLTDANGQALPETSAQPVNLSNGNSFRLMDVNGDSRTDLVGILDHLDFQFGTFINDGSDELFPSDRPPHPYVDAYTPPPVTKLVGSTWWWWGNVFAGAETCLPNLSFCQMRVKTGTRVADTNGDGRPEILAGSRAATPSILPDDGRYVFANVGTNWDDDTDTGYWNHPVAFSTYQQNCFSSSSSGRPVLTGWTELVDVNGDGLADLLEHRTNGALSNCANNGKAAWEVRNVYLNTGSGWENAPDPIWSAGLDEALDLLDVFVYQLLPVDVNGDGLVDLLPDALPSLCQGACANDGIPGNAANGWDIGSLARPSDGLADPDPNDATRTRALINTGRGWATAEVDSDIVIPAGMRPIDLDGDGLADDANGVPQLNTGTALVTAPFSSLPAGFGASEGGRVIVDIDGDGQVDLVRADGTTFEVHLSPAEPPPGFLTRIDLASGGTVSLEYEASSEGTCVDEVDGGCHVSLVPFPDRPDGSYRHADDPFCVYPWTTVPGSDRCIFVLQDLPFAVQTVTRVTTDDRNGNTAISDAAYDFGRFNHGLEVAWDREFRGFGRARKYSPTTEYLDPTSGLLVKFATLEETQFYQEAFLRGQPARTVLYELPNGDRPEFPDRILEVTVPEFGLAHGGSVGWGVFAGVFSGAGCDPSSEYLNDPNSCPPVATDKQAYIDFGAGFADAGLPYDDFTAAFANAETRDRDDAFLVLPISRLTRVVDDPSQPMLHTNYRSLQWHDRAGNVTYDWNMGAARIDDLAATIGDITPADDRMTLTAYAVPGAAALADLRNRPTYRARLGFTAGGAVAALAETRFHYDGMEPSDPNEPLTRGNLTLRIDSLEDPVNGLNTTVNTALSYDGAGHYGLPLVVSDPFQDGETPLITSYTYDVSNTFPISVSRGELQTTLSYDVPSPAPRGLGLLNSRIDPNAEVTTFGYDTFGRPTSRAGPGAIGPVLTTAYDDFFGWSATAKRRTVTISDGTTPVSTDVYLDGLGREIRALRSATRPGTGAAAVVESAVSYDLRGNFRSVARPRFCAPGGASCDAASGTSLLYDARDRLAYVVQPDGGIQARRSETRIDPGRSDPERFEVAIDAAGRRRDIRLDGAGLPAQLIEYRVANSFTTGVERTNYLYDGLGRLQLLCDPLASPCSLAGRDALHTTLLTYDSLGRITRRDDPDRGQWTYQFRGDGAPLRQTDGNGVTTAFGYDALYGRLKTVDWSANGSADVTYTYGDELGASAPANSRGRLYLRAGPTSTLERAYDTSGRVSQRKTSVGATGEEYIESFTYDWRSRIISHRYPDNETITRSYDVMGLDRIASASRTYVDRIDYNADLNPTQYTFGNGEARTRSYQPSTGHLDSIYAAKAGQPAVLHRSYGYDPSGLLGSVTDHLAASETLSNLSYDGLGRLVAASRGGTQTLSNAYDAIGNLTDKEGTAIPFLNVAKPHAPATNADPAQSLYQYDGAGNLTVKEGRTLGYDALNRLTSVSGARPISFGYDDSTERVTKQVGSDRSVFLGPDVEIMNRVRLVKTIRANGEIVARVETVLAGGTGASAGGLVRGFANRGRPVPDEVLALALLLALAGIAGALQRDGRAGAPSRAVASSLALLVAVLPVLPRLARAAIKGDVTDDNRVDVADLLLLLRHVNDGVVLPVDPTVGDVAPWSSGALGDGARNTADLLVLTRGISDPDLDADGLSPQLEARVGTSPLVADSDGDGTPDDLEDFDQDGLSNASEFLAGSDPAGADSDGDGIVDSRDARPTIFDGERAVWVHTDHLGSVAALSDESGAVVRRITYGVWGTVRSNVPVPGTASLDSAEKYTGQRYDEETSLYYYGARYYDPGLGRFIGADAVIASQYRTSALHPYAYVESNPLNYVDPSGNLAVPGVGGGGGGAGWNRPDRGGGPDIAAGLDGLLQGAIDRTIAQWAAMPQVAPPGPQRPAQPTAQPPMGTQVACAEPITGTACVIGGAAIVAAKAAAIAALLTAIGVGTAAILEQQSAEESETKEGPDFVVNPDGVAVPLGPGETAGTSPDGQWIEVKDAEGNPTGTRLDAGHKPTTHSDPRALGPHGHIPGRKNPDGTPWLPSGGR